MSGPDGVLAALGRVVDCAENLAAFADDDPRAPTFVGEVREAHASLATSADELRAISTEMRNRKVNGGKATSPTLIAWADRIDAALARIGGAS